MREAIALRDRLRDDHGGTAAELAALRGLAERGARLREGLPAEQDAIARHEVALAEGRDRLETLRAAAAAAAQHRDALALLAERFGELIAARADVKAAELAVGGRRGAAGGGEGIRAPGHRRGRGRRRGAGRAATRACWRPRFAPRSSRALHARCAVRSSTTPGTTHPTTCRTSSTACACSQLAPSRRRVSSPSRTPRSAWPSRRAMRRCDGLRMPNGWCATQGGDPAGDAAGPAADAERAAAEATARQEEALALAGEVERSRRSARRGTPAAGPGPRRGRRGRRAAGAPWGETTIRWMPSSVPSPRWRRRSPRSPSRAKRRAGSPRSPPRPTAPSHSSSGRISDAYASRSRCSPRGSASTRSRRTSRRPSCRHEPMSS